MGNVVWKGKEGVVVMSVVVWKGKEGVVGSVVVWKVNPGYVIWGKTYPNRLLFLFVYILK